MRLFYIVRGIGCSETEVTLSGFLSLIFSPYQIAEISLLLHLPFDDFLVILLPASSVEFQVFEIE